MGPSRRQIRACFCRRLPRRDTTPVLIKTKLDASDQLDVWSKYKYEWMTEQMFGQITVCGFPKRKRNSSADNKKSTQAGIN